MTHRFDDDARAAVLHHMNHDHADDNLLIARAFGGAGEAASVVMTDIDGDAGTWEVRDGDGDAAALRVPWPAAPITERREVRREIVALYDAACVELGVPARPHA